MSQARILVFLIAVFIPVVGNTAVFECSISSQKRIVPFGSARDLSSLTFLVDSISGQVRGFDTFESLLLRNPRVDKISGLNSSIWIRFERAGSESQNILTIYSSSGSETSRFELMLDWTFYTGGCIEKSDITIRNPI